MLAGLSKAASTLWKYMFLEGGGQDSLDSFTNRTSDELPWAVDLRKRHGARVFLYTQTPDRPPLAAVTCMSHIAIGIRIMI